MLQLNFRDSKPIYLQLTEGLSHLILSGALGEGEAVPTIREMAAKLTLNPNTIEKSYQELVKKGLLKEENGTFRVLHNTTVVEERTDELLMEFDEVVRELVYLSFEPEELKKRLEQLKYKGDIND